MMIAILAGRDGIGWKTFRVTLLEQAELQVMT
jgi:hypothetical protein